MGVLLIRCNWIPRRYYELKKGDVIKFGASTREYVLLTENTTSLSKKIK